MPEMIVSLPLKKDGEISTFCSQTFIILDRWLNEIEANKGKEASKIVKEAFQNNIKANVTYYESLAEQAEEHRLSKLAVRSRNIAELYKGFLD